MRRERAKWLGYLEESWQLYYDHFIRYVRGRGPIPAFRIGNLPYGILPVTHVRESPESEGEKSDETWLTEVILSEYKGSYQYNRPEEEDHDVVLTPGFGSFYRGRTDRRSIIDYVNRKKRILQKEDPLQAFLDSLSMTASASTIYFRELDNNDIHVDINNEEVIMGPDGIGLNDEILGPDGEIFDRLGNLLAGGVTILGPYGEVLISGGEIQANDGRLIMEDVSRIYTGDLSFVERGEVPGIEIPGGEIPGGEIPGGEIPGGEIPGGEIPGGEIPGGGIPGGEIPGGGVPGGGIPGGGVPGGGVPGGGIPGGGIPGGGVPGGGIPGGGVPGGGIPGGGPGPVTMRIPKTTYHYRVKKPFKYVCALILLNAGREEPLSESDPLPPDQNYIKWLRSASLENLVRESYLPSDYESLPLLYHLLWQGLLGTYLQVAADILLLMEEITYNHVKDPYFFQLFVYSKRGLDPEERIFRYLTQPIPSLTGNQSLQQYLSARNRSFPPEISADEQEKILAGFVKIENLLNALDVLVRLPTAELERLLTETIDVLGYRLDAWFTSMASRYLDQLRNDQTRGAYIGAFGWVENLYPQQAEAEEGDLPKRVEIEGEEDVYASANNAGFIYAPSMQHANAAAVLRNASLEFEGAGNDAFTIKLSSERVRQAMWVINGIQQGQPLGAILGYLFERGLHDSGLDRYIDNFREAFPLVAHRLEDTNLRASSIAARNVVDGYWLLTHWQDNSNVPVAIDDEEVIEQIRQLEEALDSVADLLLSESVYQMVGGNTGGSVAALQAATQGERPPTPAVIQTPRSGKNIMHNIGLVFKQDMSTTGWTSSGTARSRAEPHLNAWVGQLLGEPSNFKVEVHFENSAANPVGLSLKDLELEPLDLLHLAHGLTASIENSALEDRIKWYAQPGRQENSWLPVSQVQYHNTGRPADEYGFRELVEFCHLINQVIGNTRPLMPSDVVFSNKTDSTVFEKIIQDLEDRLAVITQDYFQDIGDLENTLIDRNTGKPHSHPDPTSVFVHLRRALQYDTRSGTDAYTLYRQETPARFLEVAHNVLVELQSKSKKVTLMLEEMQSLVPDQQLKNVFQRANTIFGSEFRILPDFSPSPLGELRLAVEDQPDLGTNPGATPEEQHWEKEDLYSKWFTQVALERSNLHQLGQLMKYAYSFSYEFPAPEFVQLPYRARAKWVGNRLIDPTDEKDQYSYRTASKILYRFGPMAPGLPVNERWKGLLADEWMEKIPTLEEETAVSFHYNSPNTEAPQSLLLAVPPLNTIDENDQNWTETMILDTISQAFDLMILRIADGEYREVNGEPRNRIYDAQFPIFPMIYFHDHFHQPYQPDEAGDTALTKLKNCFE